MKPSTNKDFHMTESLATELSSMSLATGANKVAAPAAKPLICPRATEYKPQRFRPSEEQEIFRSFLQRAQLPELAEGAPHDKCDTDVIIQLVRHPQMASTDPLRTVRWFRGARNARGGEFAEQVGNDGFNKANAFMNFTCRCAECGKGKGWFNELNLYVTPGSKPSAHHTSTVRTCSV